MLKKITAALGTLALVFGLVALVAGPASAHDNSVAADCTTGVTLTLANYNTEQADANHVTVTLDGSVVASTSFGASLTQTFPWSAVAASHSYIVAVTAYDDPSGSNGWTFTKSGTVSNCSTAVTPAAVAHSNAACTGAGVIGTGSYTIPALGTGVKEYDISQAGVWTKVAPGTYSAPLGKAISIQAVPASGYTFTGTFQWSFRISGPSNPAECIVPVPPTANPAVCDGTPGSSTQASYVIPPVAPGYHFTLAGSTTKLNPGTVKVTSFPTTINIVLVVESGYSVPAGTTAAWTFVFTSPGDCSTVVTPTAPTPQYSICQAEPGQSSDNGYTVPATPGVTYQLKSGAVWTDLTPGFHDLGKTAGSVEIQAVPQAHYTLSGTTDWVFTFSDASDCLVGVPAGDPVFVDGTCDATHPGSATFGTYTVQVAVHVRYEADVNGGGYHPITAGVAYQAAPGDVVTIKPIADTGYTITPAIADEKLTHTFAVPGSCLVKADFVKPDATSQSCVADGGDGGLDLDAEVTSTDASSIRPLTSGSTATAGAAALAPSVMADATQTLIPAFITIPNTPHVIYSINNVPADPGQHILDPGTYTVSAVAETGYFLQGYNGPWTEVLMSAEPCGDLVTHPLVAPSAVQVQMGCFGNGSFTLSNSINDPAALTWTVDGSVVSQGTYVVGTAKTVTVHAAANGPAYGLESGATTDWTFTFERPTRCDLTTLALTGTAPTGWIIFGYALLVSGLALVAVRLVRRRGEQA